jgi:hypothetical protein
MTLSAGVKDAWLTAAAGLVAATALSFALRSTWPSGDSPTTPTVAALKQATGEIKLRLALTLGWRGAPRETEVHDGDALFVPPGAEATLAFIDGSELAIDERSLVVIEKPRAGTRSITLQQGSVSGRAGANGLTLHTATGETTLEAQSEARIELLGQRLEVTVKKGSAKLNKGHAPKVLTAGQRAAAANDEVVELPSFPVRLLQPDAQARLTYRGEPSPVALAWEGTVPDTARVQVARDRLFAFVDLELPAQGGSLSLKRPAKGVNWWRVIDAEGRPLSEARRFTCIEDIAPTAMFPAAGEVLLAPAGTAVGFAWAPLPGITRYRVEISPSQGFEPVTVSKDVTGANTRISLSLNEAVWYWRVRAEDDTGLGVPSAPMSFRVIHKGIPEAPELLKPEIEVSP